MKIELLSLLFKHYAANHRNEIVARFFKDRLNKQQHRNISHIKFDYLIIDAGFANTACGVTAKGLLVAMGGPSHETSQREIPTLEDDIFTPQHFTTLKANITSNAQNFLKSDNSSFITYQFSFQGRIQHFTEYGSNSQLLALIFLVIQYKDDSNQLHYCLLLSQGKSFSLLEYLETSEAQHNSHILNQTEFETFLDGLQILVNANKWNEEIESFYQKSFHKKMNYVGADIINGQSESGIKATPSLALDVKWLISDINKVIEEHHKHIQSLQDKDAPKLIEIAPNTDRSILQSFDKLISGRNQKNLVDGVSFLILNPITGELLSKTVARENSKIIEALQPPGELVQTKYPGSNRSIIDTINTLTSQINAVSALNTLFEIACICVHQQPIQHRDSFWSNASISSLRELTISIFDKATAILLRDAPTSENKEARLKYFGEARKLSLFNHHKNNLTIIDKEIEALQSGMLLSPVAT